MRTTIDLPDSLFCEVKSTAAARGLKLKEFIAESLRAALKQSANASEATLTAAETHSRRMAQHFEAMNIDRVQTGPIGRFNREELHDRDA